MLLQAKVSGVRIRIENISDSSVQKNNLISISITLPGMKTLLSKQENALKETVEKPKIL